MEVFVCQLGSSARPEKFGQMVHLLLKLGQNGTIVTQIGTFEQKFYHFGRICVPLFWPGNVVC